MQQRSGLRSVASLEQFGVGHERADIAAPLGIAVNQQYRAAYDAPIVCCRQAGQSETLRAGNF